MKTTSVNNRALSLKSCSTLSDLSVYVDKVTDYLPSVNSGLNDVKDKLQIVDDIVIKIEETSSALNTCIKAIAVLSDGASVLSFVPIVGTVANVLSKVLKITEKPLQAVQKSLKIIKNAAKKLKHTTDAVQNGTCEIIDLNNSLQLFLPRIVKTVIILDYVIQIAKVLEPMAKETVLYEKIEELDNNLNKIISSAEKPISKIQNVYDEFCGILDDIKTTCKEIETKTAGIRSVISNIKKISGLFSPIGNAIEKIINAIAPIKWVLKAAACLINKVLNPVVNVILKATGLQKLIDELEAKISSCLGFDKILNEITSAVQNIDFSGKLNDIIGFKEKINSLVSEINKSLGDFSPVENHFLGDSLRKMLGDLFEVQIDPEKPMVIPDWPEVPVLNTVSVKTYKEIKRNIRFDWSKKIQHTGLLNNIVLFGCSEDLGDSDGKYPLCTELAEKAKTVTAGFSKIVDRHNQLNENVCILQHTAQLPSLFKTEVQSVSVCFEFVSKTLDFFSKLPSCSKWSGRLSSLGSWVESQSTACSEILAEIDELRNATERYQNYMDEISTLIKGEDINAFVVSVNTYARNLHVILDGFRLADEHKPEESEIAELEKVRSDVLENAKSLSEILDDIRSSLEKNTEYYDSVFSDLSQMLSEYKHISPDGYILPENVVSGLGKAAKILSEAQGIFDPLESLLDALQNCSSSSSDGMDIGSKAKKLLAEFAEKAQQSSCVESVWDLLDSLSPVSYVKDTLRDFIDHNLVVNERLFENLKNDFQRLCELLTKGFTYHIGKENVKNQFFTENDVSKLTELSIAISGGMYE